MANSNGSLAGAQNAALYNNNLNGMPSAGHYSDMQALMQNMDALSNLLHQNREEFLRVQEDLERVERIQGRQPPRAQGEVNGTQGVEGPTISSLQRQLDASNAQVDQLSQQTAEHLRLQSQYEEVLTDAVERTRNYVFAQNEYIISLHQHYTQLLQDSRKETISAQLIHQGWQASLSRLNEELKNAMKSREKEKDPYRRRLALLKEENKVLRAKLGWEKIEHGSDDEEWQEDGELKDDLHSGAVRGRPARPPGAINPRQDERERTLQHVMGALNGK